ncbi:hypothetical protein HDE_00289 [Halotydeus destructor]|nr:hypothetical protein HDE_00289 [Halotydeus destructor]
MQYLIAFLNFPRIVNAAVNKMAYLDTKESATLDRLSEVEATIKDLKLAVFDLEYKQRKHDSAIRHLSYRDGHYVHKRSASLDEAICRHNQKMTNSGFWSELFKKKDRPDGRHIPDGHFSARLPTHEENKSYAEVVKDR